jgi:NodT family efflux transporter outer membrane factor (OMF) lipoprotein
MVGPDYVKPDIEMPDVWHAKLTGELQSSQANLHTWWQVFNDPVLNSLIGRAKDNNNDLQKAVFRIEESRALRALATGEYWPNIDATGSYSRDRASENGLLPFSNPPQTNLHSAGGKAAWEIDLFGRIGRSVESQDASYQASIENYRDVLVLLYAEVATNYIELRAVQARLQYARQNVDLQGKTVKLTEERLDAELVPELDVFQAQLNLANTESNIPTLRILENKALNRLANLVGINPGSLDEELSSVSAIPVVSQEIILGIPAELLRQRPDIRKAERLLASQTALIGVATAELYPSLSLNGTFVLEATELGDVSSWGSRKYGFGPSFIWNIFDGNRVQSNIQVQEAKTKQLLADYKQTVLNGIEEVENSMVGYIQELDRKEALQRAVTAADESVRLVEIRYKNNLSDFQNVLDMQRSLAVQQDQLADSRGTVVKNLIGLYSALGGGWDEKQVDPSEENN